MMAYSRSSSGRRGFTLIEIMIVVAILVALLTILIVKTRPALVVSKKQQTRATMEALRAMIDELQQNTQLNGFYPTSWPDHFDATTITVIDPNPITWNGQPAVVHTRALMAKLLAVPGNKKIMARLPSENFRVFPAGGEPASYANIAVPVDGWGAPILYVPPNGIILKTDAGTRRVTSARTQNTTDAVPMGIQGFWMSAGDDNNYQTGKDNVYSFDNN